MTHQLNSVYGDKMGTYGDIITSYSTGWPPDTGIKEPTSVEDTAEVVGATVETKDTKKQTSVLETLMAVLKYHEKCQSKTGHCEKLTQWNSLLQQGPSEMNIPLDSWKDTFDLMVTNKVVVHLYSGDSDHNIIGDILFISELKTLIDSMEQTQKNDSSHKPSDLEICKMLSALAAYQCKLRKKPDASPYWKQMEGQYGLDRMNIEERMYIDKSKENLLAWNTALAMLYSDSRFMGGNNKDIWDGDLKVLDNIRGRLYRSINKQPVELDDTSTSDRIETVSDKAEPEYFPSKEGMSMTYPTIKECRAQSESITANIVQLREQLSDIFKQSISSGPSPDVAATCMIEPMIGEYADFGMEIARPLTHILFQIHAAGKNPIRYACWMTCSGLVAQAKALVKPYTPRPDGCTLNEYQSALKKLSEVSK